MDSNHIEYPNCSHTMLIKENRVFTPTYGPCSTCNGNLPDDRGICIYCKFYNNRIITKKFRGKNPTVYAIHMVFTEYHRELRLKYIEEKVKKDSKFKKEVAFLKEFITECAAERLLPSAKLKKLILNHPNFDDSDCKNGYLHHSQLRGFEYLFQTARCFKPTPLKGIKNG